MNMQDVIEENWQSMTIMATIEWKKFSDTKPQGLWWILNDGKNLFTLLQLNFKKISSQGGRSEKIARILDREREREKKCHRKVCFQDKYQILGVNS